MESKETKSKEVQMRVDSERLEYLAAELRAEDKERTRLLLAAVGILLASEDFICEDLRGQLEDAKSYLAQNSPGAGVVAAKGEEVEADAIIEEVVSELETTKDPDVPWIVEQIVSLLDKYTPDFQLKIMQVLADGHPLRFAEYEAEMARDKARDSLLDLVSESSYPAQAKLYDMLTDFVKRSRDELVTEAA